MKAWSRYLVTSAARIPEPDTTIVCGAPLSGGACDRSPEAASNAAKVLRKAGSCSRFRGSAHLVVSTSTRAVWDVSKGLIQAALSKKSYSFKRRQLTWYSPFFQFDKA